MSAPFRSENAHLEERLRRIEEELADLAESDGELTLARDRRTRDRRTRFVTLAFVLAGGLVGSVLVGAGLAIIAPVELPDTPLEPEMARAESEYASCLGRIASGSARVTECERALVARRDIGSFVADAEAGATPALPPELARLSPRVHACDPGTVSVELMFDANGEVTEIGFDVDSEMPPKVQACVKAALANAKLGPGAGAAFVKAVFPAGER